MLGNIESSSTGKVKIELAKMTGITPPEFTRSGKCVDPPPITRRPTTRFAYCTGIRRSELSTYTMKPTTSSMIPTSRTIAGTVNAPQVWFSTLVQRSPILFGKPTTIPAKISSDMPFPTPRSVIFRLMCMLTLTTGSAFIMWLGEQITERGVGNGMSLLIFAGIVVGLPNGIGDLWTKVENQTWGAFTVPAIVLLVGIMLLVVGFIVYVESSERRIPVQYAKRVVGRRVMGGGSTHLPLRVNSGGVMPVIFASSILTFPVLLLSMFPSIAKSRYVQPMIDALKGGEPLYVLFYVLAIIFFAYFYVSIVFRPNDMADNMRKYGGFIPGIRPGKRTADFINDVMTRITFVGALYLIVISLIPMILIGGIHLQNLPFVGGAFDRMPTWVTHGLGLNFYFGGTSLLIVVGVAMDTVKQVESQLIMRHYEGFSRNAKLRSRGPRTW